MMPSTCTHKGCQQKRSLTGGQTNDRKSYLCASLVLQNTDKYDAKYLYSQGVPAKAKPNRRTDGQTNDRKSYLCASLVLQNTDKYDVMYVPACFLFIFLLLLIFER